MLPTLLDNRRAKNRAGGMKSIHKAQFICNSNYKWRINIFIYSSLDFIALGRFIFTKFQLSIIDIEFMGMYWNCFALYLFWCGHFELFNLQSKLSRHCFCQNVSSLHCCINNERKSGFKPTFDYILWYFP